MIFGRRLGCISTAQHNTETEASVRPESIHEFVSCVQQIFAESAKMTTVSPKLASVLRLPMWRNFERAAGRALELGELFVAKRITLHTCTHAHAHICTHDRKLLRHAQRYRKGKLMRGY